MEPFVKTTEPGRQHLYFYAAAKELCLHRSGMTVTHLFLEFAKHASPVISDVAAILLYAAG